MALTPRGIWTPDSGEEYDLTVDAATTASTVDAALQKSANYGLGTTAQMNAALGDFPNGAMWFNTSNSQEYRRVSGAWAVWSAFTSSFFVPVSGVNISGSSATRTGNMVSFQLYLTGLPSFSAGSGNVRWGDITPSWRPATYFAPWNGWNGGGGHIGGLVDSTDGRLTIRYSSNTFSGQVTIAGTYPSPLPVP